MKLKIRYIPILGLALASTFSVFAATPDLPRTEILGKEYYYHEIQKGESIYGIAKQYGWDLEELVRLNPTASSEMKKGTRLYYPTGRVTIVTDLATDQLVEPVDAEPIRHKVKKGETVYGISKQYGIPVETIYALYPNAKNGIKAGEILEFPQNDADLGTQYLYYVIKPGDTLYALAKKYQTTVEDILTANPGVSEKNFRIGETVRVKVNSNSKNVQTELVEEERLASIDTYKVKKKDTWSTISKKTGVDVNTLKEANENTRHLEKDEVINVPVMQTVQVEKEVIAEDPRELTSEGIQEIYDSIHQVDSDLRQLREVRLAVLLDEPTSKKDIDFTRGMLMALEDMKDAPYKIVFKVIDGSVSTENVTRALDNFEPNILVATADKSFPAFLADYGETNHIEVVNAFDVRNELFEDNPSMVQILPSPAFFNEQVAERIVSDYDRSQLIFVGTPDPNDAIAEIIKEKFPANKVKKVSTHNLGDYDFADNGSYLLYAYPQKRDEVKSILDVVGHIKENSAADITIVGRPSWVTLTENFRDNFNDAEVIVPARCWFDPENEEGKIFNDRYADLFGGTPVKSFPNFAVSGFDIANYFIDTTVNNGGDYNKTAYNTSKGLQTDFNLKRVSNWGGFVNPVVYLLRFRPSGYVDKITL
ncbi:MAG: LysM peptidoglycan-binding domain-containing protein [Muribaculaceae bacterium]|nr:LysM peptidoglycan-binding domain-containing protein [Muribaculaceae bacterium]